jgi:succinate dehydrogenase / fumarate reductase cytochrome b subunit
LPAPDRPRLQRIFSLTGLVPLGAFLVLHVATNAVALAGTDAFVRAADALQSFPGMIFAEVLFVYAPLLAHAGIGTWLVATGENLTEPSPYSKPVRAALRATGAGALVFLVGHLAELTFRVPGARLGGGELATLLAADLSSTVKGMPLVGMGYLVGTACVVFHFAAGAWAYVARMPREPSDEGGAPRPTPVTLAWAAGVAGIVVWAAVASVVMLHATGSNPFGRSAARARAPGCPVP